MVGDKISNLIIGLKNAYNAKHTIFESPYTKMNEAILNVLRKNGFILDFDIKGKDLNKRLEVTLKYEEDGTPAVSDIKRISKQSKRVYVGYKDVLPVKNGYGISVISTPDGIISNKDAKKKKIGGEELFKIW